MNNDPWTTIFPARSIDRWVHDAVDAECATNVFTESSDRAPMLGRDEELPIYSREIRVGWGFLNQRFPVSMMRFYLGDNEDLLIDLDDLIPPRGCSLDPDEDRRLYAD